MGHQTSISFPAGGHAVHAIVQHGRVVERTVQDIASAGPLRDARLRLLRALQLFDELRRDVDAFKRTPEAVPEVQVKPASDGAQLFHLVRKPVYPPDWSLRVGEIANHLRGSLNYLAFQLVLFGSGPHNRMRDVEFPISDRSSGWRKWRDARLPGVHKNLLDHVDSLQPFEDARHPLAVLRDLSDRDRHRLRLPCCGMIEFPGFIFVCENDSEIRGVTMRLGQDGCTMTGDVSVIRRGDEDRVFVDVVSCPPGPFTGTFRRRWASQSID